MVGWQVRFRRLTFGTTLLKATGLSPEDYEKVGCAKAIIFDCDGTLVDSMPVHFLAWNETMSRYGIMFSEERFYSLGGMPSHRIIELLASEQDISIEANQVALEKEKAFLNRIALLTPIQIVIDVARSHRGVKPIAVASGGFREIIRQQLDQLAIADWFDAIVTAEDTVRHKPEPDVFLEAAKRLGVAPRDCLVFEDADLGVQAAASAEMECIDVRTFYTPRRMSISSK